MGCLSQLSFACHSTCIYLHRGPKVPHPISQWPGFPAFYLILYLQQTKSEIIMGHTDHTMQYLNKWAAWINYHLPVTLLVYTPQGGPKVPHPTSQWPGFSAFYLILYLQQTKSEIIMGHTDHTMQYLNKWAAWINYHLPVTLLVYTPTGVLKYPTPPLNDQVFLHFIWFCTSNRQNLK